MNGRSLRRIAMAVVGVFLTGVSVALFRAAAFGTDPFTTLCIGIGNLFGVTYAIVYTILCAGMLCVVFRLNKRYIGIATFFNVFCLGFLVDWMQAFIAGWGNLSSMEGRILLLSCGIVLLCFSASLYFTSNLGVSPYDAVALLLALRKAVPFRFCRMGTDVACILVGFAMDAAVGIGTLITACFMGPLIQYFNRRFSEPFLRRGNAGWRCLPRRIH